ncbi:MAG: DUF192 domain-containing protein [Planctomycetes bacterium]|nr:DUF192 domain-containing protein [Planctomycetota bacterium]
MRAWASILGAGLFLGAGCPEDRLRPAPAPAVPAPAASPVRERHPASGLVVRVVRVGPHPVRAEVADEASSRARGLMFREALAPDEGMVFVFPSAGPRHFWMKNTSLPLEIAYIDDGGRIVEVLPMRPFDTTTIPSSRPVRLALELRQGWCAAHGVLPGDVVEGLEELRGEP